MHCVKYLLCRHFLSFGPTGQSYFTRFLFKYVYIVCFACFLIRFCFCAFQNFPHVKAEHLSDLE